MTILLHDIRKTIYRNFDVFTGLLKQFDRVGYIFVVGRLVESN